MHPLIGYCYIIYVGVEGKGIPPHVSMPEMEEMLIREGIKTITDGKRHEEIVERKIVPNHLRDEDYPIPKAEVRLALQKINQKDLKEIKSEAEYKRAFYRVVMIFDSELHSVEYEELQCLLQLISEYETKCFNFRDVGFLEILKLRLEEMGYTEQMFAEDLREPLENAIGFLNGTTNFKKSTLKKISKRFKILLD